MKAKIVYFYLHFMYSSYKEEIMKNKQIRNSIFTLIFAGIVFYVMIPPLNIQSMLFWFYVATVVIFAIVLTVFSSVKEIVTFKFHLSKAWSVPILLVLFALGINLFYSPVINANIYSKRITVQENGNFVEDVSAVDFNSLPLLDKDSSGKLGDRVMGQMPELVSQFSVSELYTQINYNNRVVRVTPLEYNGVIKYFTNRSNGVKGYITVDSVDGSTNLVKLEKGMKYVPSALFNESLYRKLRFQYPTAIFGEENFELDEQGNPYWVVPVLKYKGIELLEDVKGAVILDPITGKSTYYSVDEVPTWVDHVYPSSLLIEQANDWGKYRNGFINSIIGQKNVVATTTGYNYIAKDDDIYLYTGITSATADEANIGFILSNLRTKQTIFYSVPGATETSAMESAKGQVQQMSYNASFPLLINLNNKPTYLISLKDNAGLVKMYAFVDVADYQKVVVSDASEGIEKAAQNYIGNDDVQIDTTNMKEKEITIASITSSTINGNTYYYIQDQESKKYRVKISVDEKHIPFIKTGDTLKIQYLVEEEVTEIMQIKDQ